MKAKMPFIIGIAGRSGTGKTTLILKLIPELTGRGYKVGTVKNCPHGFDVDRKGKDSYKFAREGSKGVLLISPERVAFIGDKKGKKSSDIVRMINLLFSNFDIVLVEGFSEERRIKKIEVIGKGISEQIISSPDRLIAVVSDKEIKTGKPIFKPDEIPELVNFLEKFMNEEKRKCKGTVEVIINGEKVFLNKFLQEMMKGLTLAMVSPLKRKKGENTKEIIIKVTQAE